MSGTESERHPNCFVNSFGICAKIDGLDVVSGERSTKMMEKVAWTRLVLVLVDRAFDTSGEYVKAFAVIPCNF